MPKTDKTRVSSSSQAFYIDDQLFELIIKEAEDNDRSRSYIVNSVLKEFFRKKGVYIEQKKSRSPKPRKSKSL